MSHLGDYPRPIQNLPMPPGTWALVLFLASLLTVGRRMAAVPPDIQFRFQAGKGWGKRTEDETPLLRKLCLYYFRRNIFPQDFVIYLSFRSREPKKYNFLFDTMLLRKKYWDSLEK